MQAVAAGVQLVFDVFEQEHAGGRRPGGRLVREIDMRIDEPLRSAEPVVAGDEAHLGEFGRLDAIRAATPALNGFPIEPNCDLRPHARVATRLIACRVLSRDSPSTRAAATVAPNAPAVAVW